jgi:hypothetical protein
MVLSHPVTSPDLWPDPPKLPMPFPTLSNVFPLLSDVFPLLSDVSPTVRCFSYFLLISPHLRSPPRTSAHLPAPPPIFPHLRSLSHTSDVCPMCSDVFPESSGTLYVSDYPPELSHASDTQPDDATCIPPPFYPFSIMPYPVSASPQFYVCTRHLNIVPVQHIYTPDLSSVFPLRLIINYDQLRSSTSPPPNFLSAPLPETSSDVFSF